MRREDYRDLVSYCEFALDYLKKGNSNAAKTEIQSVLDLLETIMTKQGRSKIALGKEYQDKKRERIA